MLIVGSLLNHLSYILFCKTTISTVICDWSIAYGKATGRDAMISFMLCVLVVSLTDVYESSQCILVADAVNILLSCWAKCNVGGTYELFAGRDASRSLATMTMTVTDTYDALNDLSDNERAKLESWEKQFTGRHVAPLSIFTFYKAIK